MHFNTALNTASMPGINRGQQEKKVAFTGRRFKNGKGENFSAPTDTPAGHGVSRVRKFPEKTSLPNT